MANDHGSQKEEDIVEMKKALATGSASSQSSAGVSTGVLQLVTFLRHIAHRRYTFSCAHCMLLLRVYSHDSSEQSVSAPSLQPSLG